MKRRPLTREQLIARLHRGLRPKLAADQLRDLGIVHLQNLDAIARGEGTVELMWQVAGGIFTWHRVAEKLDLGLDEMAAQMEMITSVIERYGRTGRVGFSGVEYQVARRGIDVMDALAERVDRPTAVEAATWSEHRLEELVANARAERASEVPA